MKSVYLWLLSSLLGASLSSHAVNYYVDSSSGNDANSGGAGNPLKSIQAAINKVDGINPTTIYVESGIYREMLVITHAGAVNAHVTIQPNVGANNKVVIKATDVVNGWNLIGGGIWVKTNWLVNSQQVFVHASELPDDEGYPLNQVGLPNLLAWNTWTVNNVKYTNYVYSTHIIATPLGVNASTPYAVSYPENSTSVTGTDIPKTYFVSKNDALTYMSNNPGTFYYSQGSSELYVRLKDDGNPANNVIDASVRQKCLVGMENVYAYYTFSNICFRHGNGTSISRWGQCVDAKMGVKLVKCDIQWGDSEGVILGGGSTAEYCTISNNGKTGGGCKTSKTDPAMGIPTFSHCLVASNNYRLFNPAFEGGGFKLGFGTNYFEPGTTNLVTTANQVVVENCDVGYSYNRAPGIWFDSQRISSSSYISNNFIHHNKGQGIELEISANVIACNNIVVSNGDAAIMINGSTNCSVWNNTIVHVYSWMSLCDFSAIMIGCFDDGSARGHAVSNSVLNNIVYDCYQDPQYNNVQLSDITIGDPISLVSGNRIDNNCYYRPNQTFTFAGRYSSDPTCIVNLNSWIQTMAVDSNSISCDPEFLCKNGYIASLGVTNYALSSSSPLIGAGYLNGLTTDYSGGDNVRVGRMDMGAFQFGRDLDADSADDYWEAYYGLSNASMTEDADGDGISNINEFKRQSNPLVRNTSGVYLYVNANTGNDIFSGFYPSWISNWDGPKKSIPGALALSVSASSSIRDEINVYNYTNNQTLNLRTNNVLVKIVTGTMELR